MKLNGLKHNINTILTIGYRDLIKFMRDPRRIIATFIFPFIFVGVLGSSLESNLGGTVPYNFLAFTFTGVFTQVLFQSTASGIISLIEDKENDFAQEMFIAPVSRYLIILGKIVGESSVSLVQAFGIIIFGYVIGIEITLLQLASLIPVAILAALFGGAFGVLIMSNLDDQRTANQIFPFVIFPQFFLAGVFAPINELPAILLILSRLMPLTYIVDLGRNIFFINSEFLEEITLFPLWLDALVVGIMFIIFLGIGTYLFVRNTVRE